MTKGLLLFPEQYDFHPPSYAYVENLRTLGIDMHFGGTTSQALTNLPPYAHHAGAKLRGRAFAQAAAQLVDRLQPDFVHVIHHRGAGAIPFYSKTRRCKWLIEVRTVHVENKNEQFSRLSPLKDRLTWLETWPYDRVIANTETIKRRMSPSRRPIQVMPTGASWAHFNAIDSAHARAKIRSELRLPEDAAVLVYAGAMSQSRGLERMIAGFAQVVGAYPNTHLLMLGGTPKLSPDGDPSNPKLQQQVAMLGLDRHVHFTGRLPFADIPSYYAAADIGISYVPPETAYETQWPTKLIEIMMAGLIPVTNVTLGAREVYQREDAVIACGGEVGDLAEAIRRALELLAPENASLREQLIANARARSKELDWRVLIPKYLLPIYANAGILVDKR